MAAEWTRKVVNSRILDPKKQIRYAAGSPDPLEVEQYSRSLPEQCSVGIVLGMTPELRNMAVNHCDVLISIDKSQDSIYTYQEWLRPESRSKEIVVNGDWHDIKKLLPERPGFILGDGVFGNITPLHDYKTLLESIRQILSDQGCFVTRQCLMPEEILTKAAHHRNALITKFRKKTIDDAEFGLAMRLQGYTDIAYEAECGLLNNKKVFDAIKSDVDRGLISDTEHQIIKRYFFQGTNSIPTREHWENLLSASGFRFECPEYSGKSWYAWYPIYRCEINPHNT